MTGMKHVDDSRLIYVVLHLHSPREKYWGVLRRNSAVGVWLSGADLSTVQGWMEHGLPPPDQGAILSTSFFPMHRVEKITLDETHGNLLSVNDILKQMTGGALEALFPGGVFIPHEIQ